MQAVVYPIGGGARARTSGGIVSPIGRVRLHRQRYCDATGARPPDFESRSDLAAHPDRPSEG